MEGVKEGRETQWRVSRRGERHSGGCEGRERDTVEGVKEGRETQWRV